MTELKSYVCKSKYIKKNGEESVYTYTKLREVKTKRMLTSDEIEYINTHSATEIAKHFNKSTTWAYNRKSGNYYI